MVCDDGFAALIMDADDASARAKQAYAAQSSLHVDEMRGANRAPVWRGFDWLFSEYDATQIRRSATTEEPRFLGCRRKKVLRYATGDLWNVENDLPE